MGIFYPPVSFGTILADVIALLMLCIIIEIAISWIFVAGGRVPLYNPVIRSIRKVAETLTDPIRRLLPSLNVGKVGLDLSPMIALILLGLIQQLLVHSLP